MEKWKDEEIENLIVFLNDNLSLNEISNKLNRSYYSVKSKKFNLGLKTVKNKKTFCINCNIEFDKKYIQGG